MDSLIGFEGEQMSVALAKRGDRLVFPVRKDLFDACDWWKDVRIDLFKNEQVCGKTEQVVLNDIGKVRKYSCEEYSVIRMRINGYAMVGEHKQFALLIDNKQYGRTFFETASTLSEYVDKIVKHFNRERGLIAMRLGNVVSIRIENKMCNFCGKKVTIGIGGYNKLNVNVPILTATFRQQAWYLGKSCYELSVKNFVEGNTLSLNGKDYTVKKGDTENSIIRYFLGDNSTYCVAYGTMVNKGSIAGSRVFTNINSPVITVIYDHSDATSDYYLVALNDVVEGNVFQVNGITKTALATDTAVSIASFFNNSGGYLKMVLGRYPNVATYKGFGKAVNGTVADFTISLLNEELPQMRDEYLVSVGDSVVGGNSYLLNEESVTATDADTSESIGKQLDSMGGNNASFLYYVAAGAVVSAEARAGFMFQEGNLADIRLLCDVVNCCEKENYLVEIAPQPPDGGVMQGCWRMSLSLPSPEGEGSIKVSNIIEFCGDEAGSVFVRFRNGGDAFGMEHDGQEYLTVRLPIYLQDWEFDSVEVKSENVNGYYDRGEVVLERKRTFVTDAVGTETHDYMLRVLKSEELEIDGVPYYFDGVYQIDARTGIADIRMATGLLREVGYDMTNKGEGCLGNC